jgi:hypothetical protein
MRPNQMTSEDQKNMAQAMESMLARLTQAGWIESAHNKKQILIRWTQTGIVASKQFGVLFDQLGQDLDALELSALLNIIQTMSPGGKESEDNAVD